MHDFLQGVETVLSESSARSLSVTFFSSSFASVEMTAGQSQEPPHVTEGVINMLQLNSLQILHATEYNQP